MPEDGAHVHHGAAAGPQLKSKRAIFDIHHGSERADHVRCVRPRQYVEESAAGVAAQIKSAFRELVPCDDLAPEKCRAQQRPGGPKPGKRGAPVPAEETAASVDRDAAEEED